MSLGDEKWLNGTIRIAQGGMAEMSEELWDCVILICPKCSARSMQELSDVLTCPICGCLCRAFTPKDVT